MVSVEKEDTGFQESNTQPGARIKHALSRGIPSLLIIMITLQTKAKSTAFRI
jgi:hypothetical protein